MGINTYKKKMEAYVMAKGTAKAKGGEGAKGLLAPKEPMDRTTPASGKDAFTSVGDFIYALRQKRKEFQLKNDKGTK